MEITKYERARMIGARALQLYFGAPPLTKVPGKSDLDYVFIAEKELEENVIPLVVVRETGL